VVAATSGRRALSGGVDLVSLAGNQLGKCRRFRIGNGVQQRLGLRDLERQVSAFFSRRLLRAELLQVPLKLREYVRRNWFGTTSHGGRAEDEKCYSGNLQRAHGQPPQRLRLH
jgi:hypothetical protein